MVSSVQSATPSVRSRKLPRQSRSSALVEAVLQAAIQVLATEGARRFTMARIAEKAGVSVGSLYQYFPNKAAILFRLQSDEWAQTGGMFEAVLTDPALPPLARVRRLAHAFTRSEIAEAHVRGALDDAAPLYRDAPEAHAARARGRSALQAFLAEHLPATPPATRDIVCHVVATALSAVGKSASTNSTLAVASEFCADALADMLCAYLASLGMAGPDRDNS